MNARFFVSLLIATVACTSTDPGIAVPTLTTEAATNLTLTTASVSVTIVSSQPEQITARGLCWAQRSNPEINNQSSKTENGSGAGTFTAEMTGLLPVKYYARAYATMGTQTFYGNEVIVDIGALAATITTTRKANVSLSTAEVETVVTYTHSLPITERGICWGTGVNPNITNDTKVVDPGSGLTFSTTFGPLSLWTAYYVRAYVITDLGTFYGNPIQVVMIPPVSYGNVTDIDGNNYRTVVIGTKEWMADNLEVTRYNDGTSIAAAVSQDQFKNIGAGAYIAYAADPGMVTTFGFLYNGYVVNSDKVCPTGWHVPSTGEWNQLANNLGGFDYAGGRMKEDSPEWRSPNISPGNESGFSGLPGGNYCRVCLSNTGIFADRGTDGYFWNSSANTFFYLTNDLTSLRNRTIAQLNDGFSIRCVKN